MIQNRLWLTFLLVISLSAWVSGQISNAAFAAEDDKGGFYAMTPQNIRIVMQLQQLEPTLMVKRAPVFKGKMSQRKKHQPFVAMPVHYFTNKRPHLKGPKAKNYKPWKR